MLSLVWAFAGVGAVAGWTEPDHIRIAMLSTKIMRKSTAHWVHLHLGGEDFLSSMQTASVWADQQKGATGEYHFVHTPFRECLPYDAVRDCGYDQSGKCLVSGIRKYVEEAIDESVSKTVRTDALRMLIHLVADLHQPVHLGFRKDHGGLDIMFGGGETNLHWLWDVSDMDANWVDKMSRKEIRNQQLFGYKEDATGFPAALEGDIDIVGEQVEIWAAGIVSNLSSEVTCPTAYKNDLGEWIHSEDTLSPMYLQKKKNISRSLIISAGCTLGLLLDGIAGVWLERMKQNKLMIEQAEVPMMERAKETESTSAQFKSNRYTFLSIDEFSFDPEQVIREEQMLLELKSDDNNQEEKTTTAGEPWEQYLVHVALVQQGGLYYITTRRVATDKRVISSVHSFNVEFHRNALPNRVITLHFDSREYPMKLLLETDFPTAAIYKLRAAAYKKKSANYRESGFLRTGCAPAKLDPIEGLIDKLPSSKILDETVHGMTFFNTETWQFPNGRVQIKPSDDDVKKATIRKRLADAILLPTEEERMDEFLISQIKRRCDSIIRYDTDDIIFISTLTSFTISDTTRHKPLRALSYNLLTGFDRPTTLLVDIAALEDSVTPNLITNLMACADANLGHGKPILQGFHLRPTIYTELSDIFKRLDSAKRGEISGGEVVGTISMFAPPLTRYKKDSVQIEWGLKDTGN